MLREDSDEILAKIHISFDHHLDDDFDLRHMDFSKFTQFVTGYGKWVFHDEYLKD